MRLDLAIGAGTGEVLYGLPPGIWWLCGTLARKILPQAWNGTCTQGWIGPYNIQVFNATIREQTPHPTRVKRDLTAWQKVKYWAMEVISIPMPVFGVQRNRQELRMLAEQLEELANETARGLKLLQEEINSLALQGYQMKLALDYLLIVYG